MSDPTPALPDAVAPAPIPPRQPTVIQLPDNWQSLVTAVAVTIAVIGALIFIYNSREEWVRVRELYDSCCHNGLITKPHYETEPVSAIESFRFSIMRYLAYLALLFILFQVVIFCIGHFRPLRTPTEDVRKQTDKIWAVLVGGVIAFALKPEADIRSKDAVPKEATTAAAASPTTPPNTQLPQGGYWVYITPPGAGGSTPRRGFPRRGA